MHHKPFYLVAIPEGDIMTDLSRLQKFISRRFGMYSAPYPDLHLTVGVIEPQKNMAKCYPILDEVIKSYQPFSVHIGGERCFGEPYSSVGVAVTSPMLARLAGELEGALTKAGYAPRTFSEWDFHISLVTPLFARRHWSQEEYLEACRIVAQHSPGGWCRLNHLELWDPDFPPLKVIERFSFAKDSST
ncbi:2'-5' RNA ligase family protein [Dethiobacter alkaliphilus]|uniref:2'-5' RNA ligase family protein n=1 Tax=Dethiobacter alkaliphilus TaxID=427926 RepID=UPI00222622D3|nr:hypothetical protein [Dethiobacter alkaliphilus]MCW3491166.1 hypothetical protein [Dethiobacter alkaliphilus]